jgi:hypothetical protein
VLLLLKLNVQAQSEIYPIYNGCENTPVEALENCFLEQVSHDFYKKFKLPSEIEPHEGKFYILFSANKEGTFEVFFVSSTATSVNKEVENIFLQLPEFQPATYNNRPVDKQFILYYPNPKHALATEKLDDLTFQNSENKALEVSNSPLSSMRMPLSHYELSVTYPAIKSEIHTTVKPYIYQKVIEGIVYDSIQNTILQNRTTWGGRKLWNDHFFEYADKDVWFYIDPIVDWQIGKDNTAESYTFTNTRAARIAGSYRHKLSFSSSVYESQGRFATYFNDYARALKPSGGNPASVPGQGLAKEHGEGAFDYPVATGYISYSPNQTFNFQFGRDKNFIGDGYRSLFLSDNTPAHTFLKFQTNFWHIQYTNLWLWLRDVRPEVTVDGLYQRKFAAIHHLSWQATKKLNIGFFESIIWAKTDQQGFDVDYMNPVIFFRPVEFGMGSDQGNALLGVNTKYQFTKNINLYGQVIFDEIIVKELFGSNQSWVNKYGVQLGATYNNAFKIPNLTLQAEYNMVRPFTYSHNHVSVNYGHYNQPLAHPWGSNFREGIFKVDYLKNRWFGTAKMVAGIKGLDYNTDTDSFSYGGNIYRDNTDRNANQNIVIGQGNKSKIAVGELQGGYLINPKTNLKLFGGVLVRKFDAPVENAVFKNGTTTWLTFGLRSDLSNWYFDF